MKIDVSATKEYYNSIIDSLLCNCGYCLNYRIQVKSAFPEVAEYLSSMGIDIEKPFDTSPLDSDENGFLEYCCCQYIVFGNSKPDYHYKIGDVEFRIATSYPSTGIEQEHFLIELYPIRVKYIV